MASFSEKTDLPGNDPYEREKFVLKRLLLREEYVKLEELADELYISIPTMNRVFKKVKEILIAHKLTVISRPGYGVKIEGNEMDKRICYVHCLPALTQENKAATVCQYGMTEEDFYFVDFAIRRAIENFGYDLTETGIDNLIIHMLYAVSRVRDGNYVEDAQLTRPPSETERKMAEAIIKEIEEEFHLKFPAGETDYLVVQLRSKRSNLGGSQALIPEKVRNLIDGINQEILCHQGFDFSQDEELISMLALHLEPMLSRIRYGLQLPNPVLDEMKMGTPLAYECAVIAAQYIKEKENLTVSDDELGYLALHYSLALERFNEKNPRRKFLIVCGTGMGTAKMAQKRMEKKFSIPEENIELCSLNALPKKDLGEYEYIVSTVKIPFNVGRKVVYVSDILSDFTEDMMQAGIQISDYIDEELVFLKKDFSTREEVLYFLCDQISEKERLDFDLYELVWKRECLSSTDIGNLVAIPHPFSMCTDKTVMAVCTLKKAIVWNQRKVKVVFLISFCRDDMNWNHDFNEKLMYLIMDNKFISMLEGAEDAAQLKKLFQ